MTAPADGRIDEATLAPELQAYYGDRRLLCRNVFWQIILGAGWTIVFTVVSPLMILRMNSPQIGMGERMIATINSFNGYAVSFLVMYFSWKSDHTISRWGRRVPFLWYSMPGIIISVLLFPFVNSKWILLGVLIVQMFFMDMKASTISLLGIDMVPRSLLARINSIQAIVMSVIGFFVLRYGMKLADLNEELPYLIGAGVLAISSIGAGIMLKEPPIRKPQTEPFKPWSALKVGWRDRRMIVLMLAVPLLSAPFAMYNTWLWLFAKNSLHLTRTSMGAALSWAGLLSTVLAYPCAWLIDRVNPYKLVVAEVLLQAVLLGVLLHVHNANGLIVVSFVFVISTVFASAPGMIIWRAMPPQEVGSITSAAAFVNNSTNATIVLLSGQLIEGLGHNYNAAYILGFVLSCCGFVLLMVFRWLMRKKGTLTLAESPGDTPQPAIASGS